jgi:molybdopterin converting factor small subunit
MAKLRLFANLREAAGTSTVELPGETVGDVVSAAVAEYGPNFERGLYVAKVWVNGEPATNSTTVDATDEIALIPPVSGGTTAISTSQETMQGLLVLALLVSVILANVVSVELLTFVVVVVALAWVWDVRDVLALRRLAIGAIPAFLAAAAAGNGAYAWGNDGFAGGVAVGICVVLAWSVFDDRLRSLDSVAVTLVIGSAAALATGSIVLLRLRDDGEVVTMMLAIIAATGLAAWAAQRFAPDTAMMDPNLAAIAGALLAGLVAALATDILPLATVMLAAVAVGGGYIAGRTLGSMVRSGPVVHTVRAPGVLTMFDGAIVAVPLFWAAVTVFA